MGSHLATVGKWLVLLAAGVFAANICYFFILMSEGPISRNPLTDHVVPLENHGAVVFVTHTQYYAFTCSLIVAGILFVLGAVLFAKSQKRKQK